MAAKAIPPIDGMVGDEVVGFATSRHLLDRNITEDTAVVGGYVSMCVTKAERKVSAALYKTECRICELAEGAGRPLPRDRRNAIRQETSERLKKAVQPTLSGIHFVVEPSVSFNGGHRIYATAISEKQMDALFYMLLQAGIQVLTMTPEVIAVQETDGALNPRDLPPVCFSGQAENATRTLGQDFLTYLWHFSETRGTVADCNNTQWAIGIDGPLYFHCEGEGAHEVVLRKGLPGASAEARDALRYGKKLRAATIVLACGDQQFKFTLEADTFSFRSVRLPTCERLDSVSRFQERMLAINRLTAMMIFLYRRFLHLRMREVEWAEEVESIGDWIQKRTAKI